MILLVASQYPNHPEALWNLPGGRQKAGELLEATALRELLEETGLHGTAAELAYVSESYDGETHFTNVAFTVSATGDVKPPRSSADHVVAVEWVPLAQVPTRISVAVVREPLLAYFNDRSRSYAGYPEAGISIEFPD